MKVHTVHEANGRRTLVAIYATGEEFVAGLERLATEEQIGGAAFTAIGAFRRATLGYFDWDTKDYSRIPVDEQVEVVSLSGNLALGEDGVTQVHAHAVVGTSEGAARCGHVLEGEVRPTLEVVIEESPTHLCRRRDPETGLALIYGTAP